MREVSFNDWCEAIDREQAVRRAFYPGAEAYFREVGTDVMEYVSRDRVVARAEGYDTDVKKYYVTD